MEKLHISYSQFHQCYIVQPLSYLTARIIDSRKVRHLKDFESPEQIIDYYVRYFGVSKDDFVIGERK